MKKILPLAACLLAGAAVSRPVLAQNTPAAPAAANLPNGVAAEVNGEKIQVADVNRMLESLKKQEPALASGSDEAKKALGEFRKQIVDNLIETRLLVQEAKRKKIAAKQDEVDQAIKEVRSGFKTDAEFNQWLAKDGKSEADLRRIIGEELAVRELSKVLTTDVVVSGEDIGEYYRANMADFKVPDTVTARHILLAVNPNSPPGEKERVKKRAVEIINQLKKGTAFDVLAKNNSDDPGTKERGGDLGEFPKGTMVKPFEDAAFAATAGQVVGPVETEFGFHIIRVDKKTAGRTIPLAEIQGNQRLKAFLLRQKVQKRLDEAVANLKKTAKISRAVNM